MQQPHTDNLLRPCMIIDNPAVLREACRRFSARPTEPGAQALISDPGLMGAIDRYSHDAARAIDPIWREKYRERVAAFSSRRRSYSEGIDRIAYRYDRLGLLERIRRLASEDALLAQAMLDGLEFGRHLWSSPGMPGRAGMYAAQASEREDEVPI